MIRIDNFLQPYSLNMITFVCVLVISFTVISETSFGLSCPTVVLDNDAEFNPNIRDEDMEFLVTGK